MASEEKLCRLNRVQSSEAAWGGVCVCVFWAFGQEEGHLIKKKNTIIIRELCSIADVANNPSRDWSMAGKNNGLRGILARQGQFVKMRM